MSNEVSGPWAAFYGPQMGWDLPGLPPGPLAQLQRAEAAERAREEREAAERRDRAEMRLEAWMTRRSTELAMAGIPHDPSNLASLSEPLDQWLARVYAAQDREAERADRRALQDAGLLGRLTITASEMAAPAERSLPPLEAPDAARGGTSSATPAPRTGPVAKARELLHRGGVTPCTCPSCVAVRAARSVSSR